MWAEDQGPWVWSLVKKLQGKRVRLARARSGPGFGVLWKAAKDGVGVGDQLGR